jgi:hypothetical protein
MAVIEPTDEMSWEAEMASTYGASPGNSPPVDPCVEAVTEPFCPCGARLDTYEELKAMWGPSAEVNIAHHIADAYLGPGGFYCANEDDVVPPEFVIWRSSVREGERQ